MHVRGIAHVQVGKGLLSPPRTWAGSALIREPSAAPFTPPEGAGVLNRSPGGEKRKPTGRSRRIIQSQPESEHRRIIAPNRLIVGNENRIFT